MTNDRRELETDATFQSMPAAMQEWILKSPNATRDFAEFFRDGGVFDIEGSAKLPYYESEPPRIVVDREQWRQLLKPDASPYAARHMFTTMAHEVGHHHFNNTKSLFPGGSQEDYIQHRSDIEAKAIFNAFPIIRDLQQSGDPIFKDAPLGSVGYLADIQLAQAWSDWSKDKIDDKAAVQLISPHVPNKSYTLSYPTPPPDLDGDGRVTHRDAYIRDYERLIKARPELAKRPEQHEQAESERLELEHDSRGGPNSTEPGGLSKADEALLEQLRGQVRGLDQKAGKAWDDKSERLAASALVMAKEMGFKAGDDLLLGFNTPTQEHEGGTLLHLVRQGAGASIDPAANRAMMTMQDALSQSPQERFQQVEAIGQAQAEQARLARQEEQTRGPDDPTRGGPMRS